MKSRGLNLRAAPTSTVSQRTASPKVPAALWSSTPFGGGSRSPFCAAASRCTATAAGVRRTASSIVGATRRRIREHPARVRWPSRPHPRRWRWGTSWWTAFRPASISCTPESHTPGPGGRSPSGLAVVLRTEPRQAESRPCRASIPIAGASRLPLPRRILQHRRCATRTLAAALYETRLRTTNATRYPTSVRSTRMVFSPLTGPRPDTRGTRDWARVPAADRRQYGDAEVAT